MSVPAPEPDVVVRLRHRATSVEFLTESRRKYEDAKRGQIRSIRLARHHGLSYREIAEALGVTESTVRYMLKRAEGAA